MAGYGRHTKGWTGGRSQSDRMGATDGQHGRHKRTKRPPTAGHISNQQYTIGRIRQGLEENVIRTVGRIEGGIITRNRWAIGGK